MIIILTFLLFITFFSFGITAWDKNLAKNHKNRISEKTLLLLATIGGSLGMLLAMYTFNHKVNKSSFKQKFYFILLLQIILFYYFASSYIVKL